MLFFQWNSVADSFEQHSLRALLNAEKHLSNPVNAFLVIKKFTSDWDNVVKRYIENSNSTDGQHTYNINSAYFKLISFFVLINLIKLLKF